ncbi:M12 family metallopeptidase [Aquimarina algicola]|uniref:Peptidase M12 n=1 Tax=Aquimarina algicola TaxID=2589995 RepID=A0A504IZE0_9FLAO|nr:M12 family metallopeptidase [Aquimarina algicola]TPN81715.1 peptidase M12 [Aquimarina algicola]
MKFKNVVKSTTVTTLILGLIAASCSSEDFEEAPENSDNEVQLTEKFFLGEKVLVEKIDSETYKLDGSDILLSPDQLSDAAFDLKQNPEPTGEVSTKLGLAGGIRKWPNNTVIYVLDNSLTANQIEVTRNSMEEWSTKTNVKFKQRTNENYYVTISNDGRSCNCGSANLGVIGNRGVIRIGTRTSEVVMIHEIGHTLGYIHEQNRSDRDNHVRILFENIQNGAESQFRKSDRAQLIGDFDIQSTMMYGAYTFSKNGRPTITRLDGSVYPRRSARLSSGDIAGTNQAYPGDNGGGDGNGNPDTCEGVEEWSRNRSYQVGDRVTYRGFLYERDFSRWNRIKECGSNPEEDICNGVSEYSRNTRYSAGDKVTFRGFLYELQSNGRWSNQGQCGN